MFRLRTADNRTIDASGASAPLRLLAVAVSASLAVLGSAGVDPAEAARKFKGKNLFGITAGGDIQAQDTATLSRDLDAIQAVGANWLRIDINWAEIQAGGPNTDQRAGARA